MSSDTSEIAQVVDKLFNHKRDTYIFIYSPPKVGSTTLVSSLRISLGNGCCVIHLHDEIMLNILTGIQNITINDIITHLALNGKTVYVIDVYRSPIERKMSEFFEKISSLHFNNSEVNINTYSVAKITDRFNNIFPHIANGDHYIDKYNIPNPVPFDFTKKYTIQKVDNITYVKLRLCDSSIWGSILSEIFGKEIVIINDYESSQKVIGSMYINFKNNYMLPVNFLDTVSNCEYLRLYYSEEERQKYIDGWSSRKGGIFTPYTENEYRFYIKLCLENQHTNDIQLEHYMDSGCLCGLCSNKRIKMFSNAKIGEKTERIDHQALCLQRKQQIINKILSNRTKSKFTKSQFAIKLDMK